MGDFNTIVLSGQRVLVRGTDSEKTYGETVVNSTQWDEIKSRSEHEDRLAEFDAAVTEFFQPIMDAAEEAQAPAAVVDPIDYVELSPAVVGTTGHAGHREHLSHDSKVLRLIEEGDTDRLIWVGDFLEIKAFEPKHNVPAPVEADSTSE